MRYLINRDSVLFDGNFSDGFLDIWEAKEILKKEKADMIMEQTQEVWEGGRALVDIFVKRSHHIVHIQYGGYVWDVEKFDLKKIHSCRVLGGAGKRKEQAPLAL